MKKEFWRKSPLCNKCIYHSPEGKRPDSINPESIWKEACHCCGYSFWPELEEAEICFDYKSIENNPAEDKAQRDKWAKQHQCIGCAFYETNGLSVYIPLDRGGETAKLAEWNAERRCRGYVYDKAHDKSAFCSSFLSINQWAEVQACPPLSEEKSRKWRELTAYNIREGIPGKG